MLKKKQTIWSWVASLSCLWNLVKVQSLNSFKQILLLMSQPLPTTSSSNQTKCLQTPPHWAQIQVWSHIHFVWFGLLWEPVSKVTLFLACTATATATACVPTVAGRGVTASSRPTAGLSQLPLSPCTAYALLLLLLQPVSPSLLTRRAGHSPDSRMIPRSQEVKSQIYWKEVSGFKSHF